MTDEEYKLAVALESDGADQVQGDLEDTEGKLDETSEAMEESADDAESLSKRWSGAFQAITAAVAIVSGGILSQVPVVGEALSGLSAVAAGLGYQLDKVLRPALVPLTDKLFSLSDAIFAADGAAGTLIGTLTGIGVAGSLAAGGLGALGKLLPGFTATGVLSSALAGLKSFIGALTSLVTGSLAAAGALGVLLGLFGVAILETTGVLDAVRNLGAAIGQALPAAVRDGMLAVLSAFMGPLAVIGAAISGFVSGVLDGGLREGIDRAISNAGQALNVFVGAWRRTLSRIGDVIGGVIDAAFRWGRALIEEFVSGIISMRDDVADAAGDIAGEARAHLPGSPADKGPLSDLDETGPAFAETFAAGMAGGIGRVRSSAGQVAGAADDGSDDSSNVRVSTSAPPVYLDGREISRSTGRLGRDDTAKRGL